MIQKILCFILKRNLTALSQTFKAVDFYKGVFTLAVPRLPITLLAAYILQISGTLGMSRPKLIMYMCNYYK